MKQQRVSLGIKSGQIKTVWTCGHGKKKKKHFFFFQGREYKSKITKRWRWREGDGGLKVALKAAQMLNPN